MRATRPWCPWKSCSWLRYWVKSCSTCAPVPRILKTIFHEWWTEATPHRYFPTLLETPCCFWGWQKVKALNQTSSKADILQVSFAGMRTSVRWQEENHREPAVPMLAPPHPRDPLTCWVSSARAGRGTGTFSSLAPIMDCSASSSTCREPQSCWHSWTHHSCQPQPAWHCFMSLTQLWGFLPASLGKALLPLLQFCSELLYCNMHECLNQQSSVHYSDCPFSIHQLGQSIHSHLPLREVSHSYS